MTCFQQDYLFIGCSMTSECSGLHLCYQAIVTHWQHSLSQSSTLGGAVWQAKDQKIHHVLAGRKFRVTTYESWRFGVIWYVDNTMFSLARMICGWLMHFWGRTFSIIREFWKTFTKYWHLASPVSIWRKSHEERDCCRWKFFFRLFLFDIQRNTIFYKYI